MGSHERAQTERSEVAQAAPDRPRPAAPAPARAGGVDVRVIAAAGNRAVGRALHRIPGDGAAGRVPDRVPDGFEQRLGTAGTGQPIPDDTRLDLEAGFGASLADVRLHHGPASAALAAQVGARAFTVGRDIHFGQGEYDPASPAGRHLLAHEVTHTLQQPAGASAAGPLTVSRPDSPAELEAERAATAVTAGAAPRVAEAGPSLGRDPDAGAAGGSPPASGPPAAGGTGPATAGTVTGLDPALAATLTEEDRHALAQAFPGGVVAAPAEPAVVWLRFGDRVDARQIQVIRLTAAQPVGAGVETYIMQVGKGRSILPSSIGGGSRLFDAGSGNSMSPTSPAVQRLVAALGAVHASGVAAPEECWLSHRDADHFNAFAALAQQAAFSEMAVRIARQQWNSGRGGWTAASLALNPGQRLITVDVTGGAVLVRREVVDNMELVEFRSVAAAEQLTEPGRTTFNRNRTSPVVVVRDLVSGTRSLYTADAEGQQFTEIVNAVGPAAMARLLGAEAGNLRLMEAPHHYGKQAGPDAAGLLNMLQLAYEAGDGSLRLFAQTTTQFATNESQQMRSFNFLEAIGVAPERIEGDPSPAGQSQVVRARGESMERVTLDVAGVQQALQAIQARDTPLRQGYARRAELNTMRADAAAMREALQASGAPAPLVASMAATEAELTRIHTAVQASLDAVWNQARAAAGAAGGLRGSADFTGVNQALDQVTNLLTTEAENITRSGNGLITVNEGLSVYSRLYVNAVRMIAALRADDMEALNARRAEHTDAVRAAGAVLGARVVHEHLIAAWKAMRAEWPPERIEQVTAETARLMAYREMKVELRTRLSESLQRQMELNALAESGGIGMGGPGPSAPVPMGTRVGAGIMLAVEVIRIGLEIAAQVQQANQAAAANTVAVNREGLSTMAWWQVRGVRPTVALLAKGWWSGWNVAYADNQALAQQAATQRDPVPGVPEFDRVVVTGVDADGLRTMVHHLVAELAALGDWATFVDSYPAGPVLKKLGGDWAVLLWSVAEEGYRYTTVESIAPGTAADLDHLHMQLERGQQARMDADAAAPDAPQAATVADSSVFNGYFGTDREVLVYGRAGGLTTVNFGAARPRFVREADVQYPIGSHEPLVRVKAADLATFRVLAEHHWVRGTGQLFMDQSGTHEEHVVEANSHGWAYVHAGQLQPLREAP